MKFISKIIIIMIIIIIIIIIINQPLNELSRFFFFLKTKLVKSNS